MMLHKTLFYLIGLSIGYSMQIDTKTLNSRAISEKNLTSFSGFQKSLKYFIANKLLSISDSLNYGKIIPPFAVQPNEGTRLQVLARANSERIIKIRGSQTDGRIMIMEGEILVGEGPPIHIHHREDEYFHVLKGELEFEVGDQRIVGTAGTWVYAPRFVKHRYRNVNSTGAILQFVFQPAGIEYYFEEVSRVIVAQESDWQIQAAAVAEKYEIELLGTPDWTVAQANSYVVVEPNGGQKVHVLPFPNAYYRIIVRGNQTNNQFTIIEGLIYMNEGARLHYHMNEDEMFYVVNGTLQFYVDGKQFCATAGTTVYIPRNVTQSVRNINSLPTHVQILFAPSGREKYLQEATIINDNPPVNATQANQLALSYGQVNLGEVSKWEDLNCIISGATVSVKTSFHSIIFLFCIVTITIFL